MERGPFLAAAERSEYAYDMIDHYRVLEVQPTASPEVIEKAYRALCLKYHPDRQPPGDHERATRRMQRLNASYAVLSNPTARREYDAVYLGRKRARAEEAQLMRIFLDDGLVGLFKTWVRQGME